MTKEVQHLDSSLPKIIPARVNIHHLQLRDLLQSAETPDKVLFVSRLKVEQADFASLKPTSIFCTLDFQPNCLATGCGLFAAGGQHGELALRPLRSPPSAASVNSDESHRDRPPTPWLLSTLTGGSINNAISIQPDQNASASASSSPTTRNAKLDRVESRYSAPWHRDQPSTTTARPGLLFGDEEMESELSESVFQELAAAYGFDAATVNRSSRWRRTSTGSRSRSPVKSEATTLAPIKLLISNNDQSVKMYNLRPPRSSPGAGGRIEAGLPGLTRSTTLRFSTAINHSSFSPDHRTLVSVGDTPDVFIHNVSRSGEFTKIATYPASSDACFSTSWSPDGSKFAVASQDGIVSVWDVRSSRRLAALSTSQASMTSGNGAARVVKFSPCGKYIAFTEHRNYFHVSDTVTFAETQRVAVPSSNLSAGAAAASASQDSQDERTRTSPSSSLVATTATGRRFPLSGMMADPGERFRVLLTSAGTAGQELTSRDRERRSIMHAAFMREWNRAINQVDLGLHSDAVITTPTSGNANLEGASTRSSSTSSISPATNADIERLLGSSPSRPPVRDWWTIDPSSETAFTPESPPSDNNPVAGAVWRRQELPFRRDDFLSQRESSVNISGMCWDPESESIYVSSERLIARFPILDSRRSFPSATFL